MKNVKRRYEKANPVPFTMGFMQEGSKNDIVQTADSTLTTTLTTNSGPQNSPDDGGVTSRDD